MSSSNIVIKPDLSTTSQTSPKPLGKKKSAKTETKVQSFVGLNNDQKLALFYLRKELKIPNLSYDEAETLKHLKEIKLRIDTEIKQVRKSIRIIKKELSHNLFNKDTKRGYFTSALDEYLSCFSCDREKVEELLEKDIAKMTKKLGK